MRPAVSDVLLVRIVRKEHFCIVSRNQIVRLYSRFINLDKRGQGYLDREDFLRIPELAINPLGDRIVDAFFLHRCHSASPRYVSEHQ